jgi:putative zinc finger/helix-turn-helix YgiT family protein
MLCTNCYEAKYATKTVSKEIKINGKVYTLDGIECMICPQCGDVIFTQEQSLAFDKKRINLEFSSKPILTPPKLKMLRIIINASLEEISELLHIGKNSYGRWERGESVITPSMNLLVHNLIERIPEARVNLIESEMQKAIEHAKNQILNTSLSFGEFLRNMLQRTKILKDIVCERIGIQMNLVDKIENNDIDPETIPIEVSGNLIRYFCLNIEDFVAMMNNTMTIWGLKARVSYIHTRAKVYPHTGFKASNINKIIEKTISRKSSNETKTLSEAYIAKLCEYINNTHQKDR